MMACLLRLGAGIEALIFPSIKQGLLRSLFAEVLSSRVTVTLCAPEEDRERILP